GVSQGPEKTRTRLGFSNPFRLGMRIGEKVKELYDSVLKLRDARKQANDLAERLEKAGHGKDASQAAKALGEKLQRIEGDLTQLQGEGGQDALNFPGRLDNQLVTLFNEVIAPDGRPTAGALARFEDLKPELARLLGQLKQVFDTDLASFNQLVRGKAVPSVILTK